MKKFNVQKIVDGIPCETNKKYLIINTDEPYAKEVFELIRTNEKQKGTWDAPDDFNIFIEQI